MNDNQTELKNRFEHMTRMDKRFPVIFRSGHHLDGFQAKCISCKMPFFGDMLHGVIEFNGIDKAKITGISKCDCGLYEKFIIHFHDERDTIYSAEYYQGKWFYNSRSPSDLINLFTEFYSSTKNKIVYVHRKLFLWLRKLSMRGKNNGEN